MTEPHDEQPAGGDVPGFQPWLRVMSAVFIPVLVAFFLPDTFSLYLFMLSGIIFVVSLVMLMRQERRARHNTSQSRTTER